MRRRRNPGVAAPEGGRRHRQAAAVAGRVARCPRARQEPGGRGSVRSSPEGQQGSCRGSGTCHPEADAPRALCERRAGARACDRAESDGTRRRSRDGPAHRGRPRPRSSRPGRWPCERPGPPPPSATGRLAPDSKRTASRRSGDTRRVSLTGNSPCV